MIRLLTGDVRDTLATLPDASVHMCVTSPPYFGLRDYGTAQWEGGDADCQHEGVTIRTAPPGTEKQASNFGANGVASGDCGKCGARRIDQQLGLEPTPEAYLATMVQVFREVRRVMRPDATCWVNVGSSYASGGKRANQSPSRERVPACDTDGTEPSDYPATGSVCSGPYDEQSGGSASHHDRMLGTDLREQQSWQHPESAAGHGSGHPAACASQMLLPDALLSTTPSSSASDRGASGLADVASDPADAPTSERAIPPSAHMAECIDDTASPVSPLASRRQDKALSSKACDCGSCGICFVYSAMKCLQFKAKDLMLMPELFALALQADGWWLRSDIIWSKPNPMPESVTDRPTNSHEHVFLLTKRSRYYFDNEAVREPADPTTQRATPAPNVTESVGNMGGNKRTDFEKNRHVVYSRNLRNVWTIATAPFPAAHFATFPPELAERCIRAGSRPGDTILDPFSGAGTALLVADRLGRDAIGIDLSHAYVEMARERLRADCPLFADITDAPVPEPPEDERMADLFAEAAE